MTVAWFLIGIALAAVAWNVATSVAPSRSVGSSARVA